MSRLRGVDRLIDRLMMHGLEVLGLYYGIYRAQVIERVNFVRGRIDPTLKVNASADADLYKAERLKVHLQLDGQNLTNVVDVIDFGGLFSGNAIGPSRSYAVRLATNF